MLRRFFPGTDVGAAHYRGFLSSPGAFCRVFDFEETIQGTFKAINEFLVQNGYEAIDPESLDENKSFYDFPVSLSPHPYQEQLVLVLERDQVAADTFEFLAEHLRKFRDERNWSQFHNPKDLAIALNIETSELLELFLWKEHQEADKEKVKEELADILSYTLLLLDKYKLNAEEIVLEKIAGNNAKYPADKARDTSKKYNELK